MTVESDLISLLVAFGTNMAICGGLITGFSLLRPINKVVYSPRLQFQPEAKRPKPLNNNVIPTSWMLPVLLEKDRELVPKIGLDAVMFLRFVLFLVKMFGGALFIAIPLCAIHYSALKIDPIDPTITPEDIPVRQISLDVLTISNMKNPESNLFYVHTFGAWLLSLWAFYLLFWMWMDYIELRNHHFSSFEYLQNLHNRCLLVTDIPDSMQTQEAMLEFLKSAQLPYEPKQILFNRDFENLPELVKDHTTVTLHLEKVLTKYLKDPYNIPPNRPVQSINYLPTWLGGVQVDSIDYSKKELHRLERDIFELRAQGDQYFKPNSSAFILFETIKGAHSTGHKMAGFINASARTQSIKPPSFKLSPHFEHLIWDNVGINPALLNTRRLIALGLLVALAVSWTFVQTFVKGISSLDTISQYSPSLADYISNHKAADVFVKIIVGPCLTALLNFLLPMALRLVAQLQGVKSIPGVAKSVLYKFFAFQVYNVVIVGMIGFAGVKLLVTKFVSGNTPYKQLWQEVATDIVTSSTALIYYLLAGYTAYGVELIQGAPLVIGYIKRNYLSVTPRQEYALNDEPAFDFMITYGYLTLIMLIGFLYMLIAPIVVPFIFVLVCLAMIVFRYQLNYVYESKYETGGTWWPKVFNLVCLTLGAFQLATFGAIVVTAAAKSTQGNGKTQSLLVGILPFFTGAFYFMCVFYLAPKAQYVSKNNEAAFSPIVSHHDSQGHDVADQEAIELLENRVQNPALVRPLYRVWVPKPAQEVLSAYYAPEFTDLVDFVRKTKTGKDKVEYLRRVQQQNRAAGVFQKAFAQSHKQHVRREIVLPAAAAAAAAAATGPNATATSDAASGHENEMAKSDAGSGGAAAVATASTSAFAPAAASASIDLEAQSIVEQPIEYMELPPEMLQPLHESESIEDLRKASIVRLESGQANDAPSGTSTAAGSANDYS